MEKWVGKIAVVTGASAGIGAAIVSDFAKAGIHVVGLARRVEKIEELIKSLGLTNGKVYAYKCDVSDQESINTAFKWIEEKFGKIHILVNNAGVVKNVGILDTGDEVGKKLNETINTNFTGLIHCTRAGFQLIKKSNDYGFIININSIAGQSVPFIDGMKFNVYPATKHAVRAASEVLRQELISMKNNKIRISSISPGAVATDITVAGGFTNTSDYSVSQYSHLVSEDIAHSILYLLSTPYSVNITELTIKPVGERF